MGSKDQLDLTRMNRAVFEALEPAQLVELTCRLHTMAMELSERLALNSTNSSRPPSSNPPFGGGGDATGSDVGRRDGGRSEGATPPGAKAPPPSGRKPGKQPGAKGTWRDAPLKTERTTAVFHIGSRRHEEIRDLFGDAILGWLVTDGYGAYRDYARRQRCLAHYADAGIMPTAASKPAPAAVFAAMGSA